jgi:hypothetical protein
MLPRLLELLVQPRGIGRVEPLMDAIKASEVGHSRDVPASTNKSSKNQLLTQGDLEVERSTPLGTCMEIRAQRREMKTESAKSCPGAVFVSN